MNQSIAVIGAGLSGLGAGSLLRSAGVSVKIFEKSRGVSGRAASRSRDGCRYDHGANYFTVEDPEVHDWIYRKLSPEGLVQIDGEILPFDDQGNIGVADPNRANQPKYSFSDGISSLGKKMRDQFDLEIVHGSRIEGLVCNGSVWNLIDENGVQSLDFDGVVVTVPLPQTVQMIENSQLSPVLKSELLTAFFDVRYFCQYSVVLNFAADRKLPGNAFALINADRGHDISWVSDERFKTGHVPEHESLFVVQMGPHWSAEHEGEEKEKIARHAFRQVCELVGHELPSPRWSDVQWWRYAHPQPGAEISVPASAAAAGLFFAGDGFVGKGRVAGALKSGFATAREMIDKLHLK